jgi:peptidyl-prolyl cis-trans isomerase D
MRPIKSRFCRTSIQDRLGAKMALGFMRRHRRWLYVFLWLVIAAFIILYIPAFQGAHAGSPGETLASVGGLPISVGEFQKSYLRQRQVYERMYQGKLDPAMLKRLGLEEQVFDGLVAERLVALEAKRLGLQVDDDAVAREIATAPDYQRNGAFIGTAEIRRLLEMRGMSVEEFEEGVRSDLLRRKLEALLAGGVAVTPGEAEREFRRRTEQIKAEYALVDLARFKADVAVSDDEIKTRFEARKDSYRIPERRVVSFALLDLQALRSRVSVTDADLEADYQEHKDEFKQEEQVCASHILVKVKARPEDKEGHPDAEAKGLAEALLKEVKGGADFAALAKRASEDKGSASNGGDLSCFGRGSMVPEFENVAFDMKAGDVSDLVKTAYGYHVIKVASHREEQVLPLAQVKDQLRERLVLDRARALAEQKAEAMSAALTRGRSLDEAAKEQGLATAKSAPFGRGELPAPLGSSRLVSRAFELKPGETAKEAFPLPQGFALIALAEVQPPRTPDLKEVQDTVRADLVAEKAREKARAVAADLRAKADKAGLDKAAAALGLVRKETPSLVGRGQPLGDLGSSAALDAAAFALPEKTLSDPIPIAAGFAVLRVLEKQAFDAAAFEKEKDALVASLRAEKQGQLFQSFLEEARKRVVVERRPDVFKRAVG